MEPRGKIASRLPVPHPKSIVSPIQYFLMSLK
jgi:hypothetical protein